MPTLNVVAENPAVALEKEINYKCSRGMHQPWILSRRIGEESCDGSRKNNTLEVHVYQVECCREELCDTSMLLRRIL